MDEKKPKTIAEEAGLPDNWIPVDVKPLVPSSPEFTGYPKDDAGRLLQAVLPPAFQHDTSFVDTAYKSPNAPRLSLMPLGPNASAAYNAAIQSTTVINSGSSTPVVDVESVAVNVQSGTTYTVGVSDNDTLISLTNNSGGTITLPSGATTGASPLSFVQGAGGDGLGTGATAVFSGANTAGNTIVVIATASLLDNITNVPINAINDTQGNTYAKLNEVVVAASGSGQITNVSFWVATNIAGGAGNHVTSVTGAGAFFCMISVLEYTPSKVFLFDGQANALGLGGPVTTPAVSTTGASDLLLAAGFGYANAIEMFSPGPGYTMRVQFSDNITIDAQMGVEEQKTAAPGNFSATMSVSPSFAFPLVLFAAKLTAAPGILLPSGFYCWIENTGSGTFLVTSPTNIDGVSQNVTLGPNQGSLFVFDGFSWFTERGIGLATPVTVPNGGTGRTTLTAHNVLLGEGISPVGFAPPVSAGYVLTDNGPGVDPTFQSASSVLPIAVKINGTGVSADKQFFMNGISDGSTIWGVLINGTPDGG